MSRSNVLVSERLSFNYPRLPAQRTAPSILQEVSFALQAGEWVVLLGPTGSGKTTLCWALAELIPQLTGGTLTGKIHRADGQSIGLVFQDADAQLFNMSVEDELAFGLETSGLTRAQMQEQVEHWLAWARLTQLRAQSPWQLSGGQKKRLALAAVLAQAPSILLLDEPMAGLDPLSTQEVIASLNDLRQRRNQAVFIATADVELAVQYADRLLVMDEGRIVYEGTPRDFYLRVEESSLGAPQVAQLAKVLRAQGEAHTFITVDEAVSALASQALSAAQPDEKNHAPIASVAPSALQFEDVWFRYPEADWTLRAINLMIAQGSFVALVGANGSGKTTLAKQVNGLLRPTRGRVKLHGRDSAAEPIAQLARQVGYVFQNPDHQLFAASAREELAFGLQNIGLGTSEIQARVQAALDAFGLNAIAQLPPATFGYGARRLVTLAAVWAMRPAVWVLDEPTTGLDARYANLVMTHAQAAQQAGATIVLISHDIPRIAAYAERVIVMEGGRVGADGTPRQVFADSALLQRTRLAAPPVTQIAQQLGWSHVPLQVREFVDDFMALRKTT